MMPSRWPIRRHGIKIRSNLIHWWRQHCMWTTHRNEETLQGNRFCSQPCLYMYDIFKRTILFSLPNQERFHRWALMLHIHDMGLTQLYPSSTPTAFGVQLNMIRLQVIQSLLHHLSCQIRRYGKHDTAKCHLARQQHLAHVPQPAARAKWYA